MKRLLPFFLLLSSSLAQAEPGAYRVEVIIFRHLTNLRGQIQMPQAFESDPGSTTQAFESDPDSATQAFESDPGSAIQMPTIVKELRSFSQFPALVHDLPIEIPVAELLTNPAGELPADEEGNFLEFGPDILTGKSDGDLETDIFSNPTDDQSNDQPDEPPDEPPNDLPDDLQVLSRLSGRMNRVWRRLSSSKSYRPLIFAAWEQNRTDYYPPMRIHDEQVIDTQLRSPTHIMIADLAAYYPLAAYRNVFYRLDGSVQLRRSRFLHLYVDLVYRDETGAIAPQPGFNDAVNIDDEVNVDDAVGIDDAVSVEDLTLNKPQHSVFSLRQNRQISTGKLQYFDTPYLGALIFVTAKAQGSNLQGSDSNATISNQ